MTSCAGSMSIRISRALHRGEPNQKSVGASSVPIATMTSRPSTNATTGSRCSADVTASGWSSGTMPLPLVVLSTGALSASASAMTSAAACRAPPPTISAGVTAVASAAAASAISAGSGPVGRTDSGATGTAVPGDVSRSNGISRCTGRGRPDRNDANACAIATGISACELTRCE